MFYYTAITFKYSVENYIEFMYDLLHVNNKSNPMTYHFLKYLI